MSDAGPIVRRLTQRFGELPQVVAVVLAGSRGAGVSDLESDFDLYVYTMDEVAVEFRRALLGEAAEIDNRFWKPGDEWSEPATCTQLDIMCRSPEWIEDQLDRVLVRQESAIGYTTYFWYNVAHSEALSDPRGWYRWLHLPHKKVPLKLRSPYVLASPPSEILGEKNTTRAAIALNTRRG